MHSLIDMNLREILVVKLMQKLPVQIQHLVNVQNVNITKKCNVQKYHYSKHRNASRRSHESELLFPARFKLEMSYEKDRTEVEVFGQDKE